MLIFLNLYIFIYLIYQYLFIILYNAVPTDIPTTPGKDLELSLCIYLRTYYIYITYVYVYE